ncbi:hypothetical protein L0B53_18645 (plasmid) [Vibrio sp. SS-MA-C1-2]|uniref:hypothetical protein n=1 Tax=Vibrio sp. SS-MA-C1-2 TaxID=2908646 RepID=UPI001F1FD98D|nr:hypothetical protein [Vibrio sp. SS-MA-C1-2]UJF20341.1 hypothetical protein L0B53_18645 [Vibrio sp. SS-MA-C1-2]
MGFIVPVIRSKDGYFSIGLPPSLSDIGYNRRSGLNGQVYQLCIKDNHHRLREEEFGKQLDVCFEVLSRENKVFQMVKPNLSKMDLPTGFYLKMLHERDIPNNILMPPCYTALDPHYTFKLSIIDMRIGEHTPLDINELVRDTLPNPAKSTIYAPIQLKHDFNVYLSTQYENEILNDFSTLVSCHGCIILKNGFRKSQRETRIERLAIKYSVQLKSISLEMAL